MAGRMAWALRRAGTGRSSSGGVRSSNAARTLFVREGYDGATMPAIAREAELAPGTLYLYFPGKEALYSELLLEGYDALRETLQRAVPPQGEPRAQAEALVDAFLRFAEECPHYFDMIFFVVQRGAHRMDEVLSEKRQWDRLVAREGECKQFAAEILRGTGSDEAGLANAVDAMWSMLVGVVLYFHKRGPERFRPVGAEAKRVLLDGLFGPA